MLLEQLQDACVFEKNVCTFRTNSGEAHPFYGSLEGYPASVIKTESVKGLNCKTPAIRVTFRIIDPIEPIFRCNHGILFTRTLTVTRSTRSLPRERGVREVRLRK